MDAMRLATLHADVGVDWSGPCSAAAKQGMMIILVTCFIIQSCLVYFDANESPSLSVAASRGRRIWHQHNCQTCHQFFGFGGFLGPDLTNVSERLTPGRLNDLLTVGSSQMPAFNLAPEEIADIRMFLEGMNETGQGQARFGETGPSARLVRAIENQLATETDPVTLAGYDMFTSRGCQGCHIERKNIIFVVPDLMDVTERLDRTEIMNVLENGRRPKMLAPFLSAEGREQTYEFLLWLRRHRESIDAASAASVDESAIDLWRVPWWEFN